MACRSEPVKAIKNNYNVLLEVFEEIIENFLVAEMRAKGKGLLYQMKTLEFLLSITMMQSILEIILKVSSALQSPKLDLLTTVYFVDLLKSSLSFMRNSPEHGEFNTVFKKTLEICADDDITIPKLNNRQIS